MDKKGHRSLPMKKIVIRNIIRKYLNIIWWKAVQPLYGPVLRPC